MEKMGTKDTKLPIFKWKRVENITGPTPRPRHGHRAVAVKDLIVIFGGGNEGLHDGLHVFDTESGQWYEPSVKGDFSPSRASFGFVLVDKFKIIAFGGMTEYGVYTNDLFELQVNRWEWRRLRPCNSYYIPCPRLGHSFNLLENRVFMFGGLSKDSKGEPLYLNDLFVLNLYENDIVEWKRPITNGPSPPARESHSAVMYQDQFGKPKLVIYGGMNGNRLGDLWTLHIGPMRWTQVIVCGQAPLPRSLHSATVSGHYMFVFGGWVPDNSSEKFHANEQKWRCSNQLACLNLETMVWEQLLIEVPENCLPGPRAGHCAVAFPTRIYIWSGRDGYFKAWNNQVCRKDLWFLELKKPAAVGKLQLNSSEIDELEVSWPAMSHVSHYILQIQKFKPQIEMVFGNYQLEHSYASVLFPEKYNQFTNFVPSTKCQPVPQSSHIPVPEYSKPASAKIPLTQTTQPPLSATSPFVIKIPPVSPKIQSNSNPLKVLSPVLSYNPQTTLKFTTPKSVYQISSPNRIASDNSALSQPLMVPPSPATKPTIQHLILNVSSAYQANNNAAPTTSYVTNSLANQSQPEWNIQISTPAASPDVPFTQVTSADSSVQHIKSAVSSWIKSGVPASSPIKSGVLASSSQKSCLPSSFSPIRPAETNHSSSKKAVSSSSLKFISTLSDVQSPSRSTVSVPKFANSAVAKAKPKHFIISADQLSKQLAEGKIILQRLPRPKQSCVIIQTPPVTATGTNRDIKVSTPDQGVQREGVKFVELSQVLTRPVAASFGGAAINNTNIFIPKPSTNAAFTKHVASFGGAITNNTNILLTKPMANEVTTPMIPGNKVITIKRPDTIRIVPKLPKPNIDESRLPKSGCQTFDKVTQLEPTGDTTNGGSHQKLTLKRTCDRENNNDSTPTKIQVMENL